MVAEDLELAGTMHSYHCYPDPFTNGIRFKCQQCHHLYLSITNLAVFDLKAINHGKVSSDYLVASRRNFGFFQSFQYWIIGSMHSLHSLG